MIQIMSSNGEVQYGVNDYVIDFDSELDQIVRAEAGSTAYSIESGTTFIKDNSKNWNVFTNNSGGGSGGGGDTPELPDNILQIYEMDYNEFWDNYNTGNLLDGLYDVQLDETFTVNTNLLPCDLGTPNLNKIVYNGYGWIFSYESNVLLQINENGEIVNIKNLDDIIPKNTFTFPVQTDTMVIDADGFLYISCNNEKVLSVNTIDISNSNNWNIIDSNPDGAFDSSQWYFSATEGRTSSTMLSISDGGTFAYNNYQNRLAYFKQGKLQTVIDSIQSIRGDNKLITCDYTYNTLYKLYYDFDVIDNSMIIKLYSIKPDGSYTAHILNEQFKIFNSNFSHLQMFIRNDILYIQFVINSNTLYYYLFDTITNTVIQEEMIQSPKEGVSINSISSLCYNDICHYDNYSIIRILYSGWYSEIQQSNWQEPLFLKINYKEDASYVELLQFNKFGVHNAIKTNQWDYLFNKACNKDKQYLYKNQKTNKLHLLSLDDMSDIELTGNILNNVTSEYVVHSNGIDFVIASYESGSYDIGCIKIDAETGNIVAKMLDVSTDKSPWRNEYFPEDNIIFYDKYMIDIDNFFATNEVDTSHLSNYLFHLDNNPLYYTRTSISSIKKKKNKVSIAFLLYKNNILLYKHLEERQIE